MKPETIDRTPSVYTRPRILVADDDSVARHLITRMLSPSLEVVPARDGREAMELLEASNDFACAIFDDQMPFHSGVELTHYLRETPSLSHIPVVIITAGSEKNGRRQAEGHRAGAAAFLNKPFTRVQLVGLVEMLLRRATRLKTA